MRLLRQTPGFAVANPDLEGNPLRRPKFKGPEFVCETPADPKWILEKPKFAL